MYVLLRYRRQFHFVLECKLFAEIRTNYIPIFIELILVYIHVKMYNTWTD